MADQANQTADLSVTVTELMNPFSIVAHVCKQSSQLNPLHSPSQKRAGSRLLLQGTTADDQLARHQYAAQNHQRHLNV